MRLLLASLLLMLGGCFWTGPAFYAPDPSVAPAIGPGRYRLVSLDNDKAEDVSVTTPGGFITFTDGTTSESMIAVPLRVPGRTLWVVQSAIDWDAPSTSSYGLLERRDDRLEWLPAVPCEGSGKIVRAAGGRVVGDPRSMAGVSCRFSTRETLEAALTAYAARHHKLDKAFRIQMTRIGD